MPRRHPPHGTFFFVPPLISTHPPCPVRSILVLRTLRGLRANPSPLVPAAQWPVPLSPTLSSFGKGLAVCRLIFPATPLLDGAPPLRIFRLSPGSVDLRRPGSSSFVCPPDGDIRPPSSPTLSPLSLLWNTRVSSFCLSFSKSGLLFHSLNNNPHSTFLF